MTWRIVVVNSTCKLDLRMNYLVIRGEVSSKIHLSEISVLILENTSVSMTAALLCELNKRKTKIIFCDEKRNPYGELIPYSGCHDSVKKLREQIGWSYDIKEEVWTEIIRQKITNQKNVLKKHGKPEWIALARYLDELERNDGTNREGHAAKVYFNALFGNQFYREDASITNACLNYGYAIIHSAVNREISVNGYTTQLGLFHSNVFNPFNLGNDLMEPLRPFVDDFVYDSEITELDSSSKRKIIDILNKEILFEGRKQYLINAIKIYCKSVLDALSMGDVNLVKECIHEG